MRLSRILLVPASVLLLGACGVDDGPVSNARPSLATVRFINAISDEGAVDARMVDQTAWSAYALGINFRQSGLWLPTEAGSRPVRVWRASNVLDEIELLVEQTVDIPAGQTITLLLTGSVQAGTARIEVMPETLPDSVANNYHVRAVNVTDSPVEVSWVAGSDVSAPTAVPSLGSSAFVARPLGDVTASFNAPGAPGTTWTAQAPKGAAQSNGIGATAGTAASGSALSAWIFPASVVGSRAPQEFTSPGVVWFVDRVPAPPR